MKRLISFFVWTLMATAVFAQRFEANWASLEKRKIPEWFHNDKFGIFIHWGVYAVPAFAPVIPNSGESYSEWYWNSITEKKKGSTEFHNKNYGADFEYPKFEAQFKAELFDPAQWAEVFKESGAKYVVLTSKHHEGYCLWNSPEADRDWGRPWNAVTGTPKRNLLGDLTDAVRQAGLKMGYYYSLYEWYNPVWKSDKTRFVNEHMIPQFKDLVTRYKPSVIFSDGEWDLSDTAWKSEELLAWLFNESPVANEVVVNDRWGSNTRGQHTSAIYSTSEYGSGMDASITWEENQGIGHSYGYNRNEQLKDYKSSEELILMLADIVSRGGNLLLDVGPAADGTIPVIMQQRLLDIGKWLKTNGEAIYGTSAYKQSYQWSPGKIPAKSDKTFMAGYSIANMIKPSTEHAFVEGFFTKKGKDLFYIVPGYKKEVRLRKFKMPEGATAALLHNNTALAFKQTGEDCVIDLSRVKPGDVDTNLFVIKLKGAL